MLWRARCFLYWFLPFAVRFSLYASSHLPLSTVKGLNTLAAVLSLRWSKALTI
jgi:hypothetical protein